MPAQLAPGLVACARVPGTASMLLKQHTNSRFPKCSMCCSCTVMIWFMVGLWAASLYYAWHNEISSYVQALPVCDSCNEAVLGLLMHSHMFWGPSYTVEAHLCTCMLYSCMCLDVWLADSCAPQTGCTLLVCSCQWAAELPTQHVNLAQHRGTFRGTLMRCTALLTAAAGCCAGHHAA
jgi:hypothetical protein